jgi:hypothetical protein
MHKYIFIAGAPGSGWSKIASSIYESDSIERSDSSEDRTFHFINSNNVLEKSHHHGSYFGPDQEFGKKFDRLSDLSIEEIEAEMNRPFTGSKTKIIKCHDFSYQLDFLAQHWPDCPIITCERPVESSYYWWNLIGGQDIEYPSYESLKGVDHRAYIEKCNSAIISFNEKYAAVKVHDNTHLCELLEIDYVKKLIHYDDTNIHLKVN